MFTLIISIAITIIMLAYLFRMLNRVYRTKSWFTEFIVIMLCLLTLTLLNPDTAINSYAINEAYEDGFHDAIITAKVVDYNNDGYVISFGDNIPELHSYTHD